MKKLVFYFLLIIFSTNLFSQVTIISENFGTTLGLTIPVNSYTGYQNNGILSFTGTATARNTSPSTGYAGSSGFGNVFFNTNQQLTISNINTLCFANITLSVGIFKSTRISDGSDFIIEYSEDGVTYIQLPYSLPTGNLTSIWRGITLADFLPSVNNLTIRFRQTGTTTQFRIDDINISGIAIPFDTTYIELRDCSSFSWDGVSYDVDSVYIFKRKTYQGCDSIISVDFQKDENNIGCVLPVELTNFFGYQENYQNRLFWETASEINNNYFSIERSNGGKFYEIGKIYGNNFPSRYEFIDDNFDPSYKIIYYRLKQVDFDKRFEYSDIISIENDIEVEITYFYNLLGQEITDIENFRGFYTKTIFYKNGQYQHKKLYKDY